MFLAGFPLSPGPKLLLLHIVHNVLESGWSCPSQVTLARMYKRSERTIQGWIMTLELSGYIERVRRGRGRTNRYYLSEWLWKRIRACTPEELGMIAPVHKITRLTDRSHISHVIRRLVSGV